MVTGLMLARDQMLPPQDRHRGVAYVSSQTHSSIAKGLRVLGFLPEQIRKIAVDSDRRLDVAQLTAVLRVDQQAGRLPFTVVASCGTTNTGSIDDLHAIAIWPSGRVCGCISMAPMEPPSRYPAHTVRSSMGWGERTACRGMLTSGCSKPTAAA